MVGKRDEIVSAFNRDGCVLLKRLGLLERADRAESSAERPEAAVYVA